jgi:hypothetical protein
MSGGAFDKYRGPVSDFSKVCFVCGDIATHAVRAKGNVRVLGCCPEHVDSVKKFIPEGKPPVSDVLMSKDGATSTDEMPDVKDKVTLRLGGV